MTKSKSNEGTSTPDTETSTGEKKDWASFTPEERAEADTSGVDGNQFLTEAYGVEGDQTKTASGDPVGGTDQPVGADESGS